MRAAEESAGFGDLAGYTGFQDRAQAVRTAFLDALASLTSRGKTVAAFGAAAKGNTFLNFCGVGAGDIAFAVDSNPMKQGTLLPGSHIEVLGPEAIAARKPDVVLILPWNIADEIAGKHDYIREWGGRFMIAVPEPRFF